MVLFVEISNNFIYNYIVIIFRSRYGMKNKIKIFLLFISKCISTKDITWFIDAFKKDPEKSSWSELNLYKQI